MIYDTYIRDIYIYMCDTSRTSYRLRALSTLRGLRVPSGILNFEIDDSKFSYHILESYFLDIHKGKPTLNDMRSATPLLREGPFGRRTTGCRALSWRRAFGY